MSIPLYTAITDDIKVSVSVVYQARQSMPLRNHYVFAYQIIIENLSPHTVQLLRRHWFIFDTAGQHREVEGEGVIGLQPTIPAGGHHHYTSFCNLTTDMGTMHGYYLMRQTELGRLFNVTIPKFLMEVPIRWN